MIKIDGRTFYLAAGETCCILQAGSDGLRQVYFGKRVESEDDLSALGVGSDRLALSLMPVKGSKNAEFAGFEFETAEILEAKPAGDRAALRGGKSLRITLRCGEVKAELIYTPYPRGGFTRAVTLLNKSFVPFKINPTLQIATVSASSKPSAIYARRDEGAESEPYLFTAVAASDCGENSGEAYGFLCVYGNGRVFTEQDEDRTRIFELAEEITLGPNGRYCVPEVLAVYSDRGVGGMSRIFHDILRENLADAVNIRRPVVLFVPDASAKKPVESVSAATELGCDVFAVDCSSLTDAELRALSSACKTAGIKFGIKITPDNISKSSALFGEFCCPSGNGDEAYRVDPKDVAAFERFIERVKAVIAANGIEFVTVDVTRGGIGYGEVRALCSELSASCDDLVTEYGATDTSSFFSQTLCYPPCVMRNTVSAKPSKSFKTRFDIATFGNLAYALDPLTVSAEVKRAVRAQVFSYQDDAPLVMNGDLYRSILPDGGRCMTAVSKDKSKAYAVCERIGKTVEYVKFRGLDEHNVYHLRELNKSFSGAALIYCGIALPPSDGDITYTFHLNQVADFD